MTPDAWDNAEEHQTNDWLRRADGSVGTDWLSLGVGTVCALGVLFLAAQLVRAAVGVSFGAGLFIVLGSLAALFAFAVLLGSAIREGTR